MISFKSFLKEIKQPTGDLKKACWTGYTAVGLKKKGGRMVPNCVPEEVEMVDEADCVSKKDVDTFHKKLDKLVHGSIGKSSAEKLKKEEVEQVDETAAWKRKEGKSPTGGLNAKGIASYRKENPGSKLKMAVTGKVKPGSKAAKRRKSFCARMSGMKGPMKKPSGEPTRKALSLRKWKCR